MEEMRKGKYGKLCTSDYVLDEVATFISQRLKRHNIAVETLASILTSKAVDLLKVDITIIQAALSIFRENSFLSFTDATTCALMNVHAIKQIATFDQDFARMGFRVVKG